MNANSVHAGACEVRGAHPTGGRWMPLWSSSPGRLRSIQSEWSSLSFPTISLRNVRWSSPGTRTSLRNVRREGTRQLPPPRSSRGGDADGYLSRDASLSLALKDHDGVRLAALALGLTEDRVGLHRDRDLRGHLSGHRVLRPGSRRNRPTSAGVVRGSPPTLPERPPAGRSQHPTRAKWHRRCRTCARDRGRAWAQARRRRLRVHIG